MAIPTYEELMFPILLLLQDGKDYSSNSLVENLAEKFLLTEEEIERRIPSGRQTFLQNRAGWARTHLKKAGLIVYVDRGIYRISAKGTEIMSHRPTSIDNNFLRQFPEFAEWLDAKPKTSKKDFKEQIDETEKTPDESLESAYLTIRNNLAAEILEKVKSCSPSFFERLVVELLVKMGYGGTLQEAGQAVGRSGDGGIDGIINEDRLGLDVIYIQAKRWEGGVSRPEIQKFAGALQGKRARRVSL